MLAVDTALCPSLCKCTDVLSFWESWLLTIINWKSKTQDISYIMLRATKSSEYEMSCLASKGIPISLSLFIQETCPNVPESRGDDSVISLSWPLSRSQFSVDSAVGPVLILAFWCHESLDQDIVDDLFFLGKFISLTATSVPLYRSEHFNLVENHISKPRIHHKNS